VRAKHIANSHEIPPSKRRNRRYATLDYFEECHLSLLLLIVSMPTTLISAEMPTPPFLKSHGGDIMSVVGIDIISKRGKRRCTPLEIRAKMYEDVIELGRQGLKYKEIQKIIYEKYGKQISRQLIGQWINGKHHPLGKVNKFDGKFSPKLAYIISAILSDGCKYINKKKSQYSLELATNDKEFAEEFGRCLAKVLGRKKPYKPFWDKNKRKWKVAGYGILLCEFLDKPLEEMRPYIEHSKENVSAFLRALFDGDGSIYVKIRGRKRRRALWLYNTNKELLIYAKYLLKRFFDIDSTLHLATREGSITYCPNGVYKATKNCYYLYIRAKSLFDFYKHIGFTIKRKQRRLLKAI
jgi:intein-encoded DNA endonuclease-like protein